MAIRIARHTDLARMLEIYTPFVESTSFSLEYTPPSMEEFKERFDRITAQFPWLVWEEDGQVTGYVYASAPFSRAGYRWCAEPSIYIDPAFHGRGIGRELYRALEEILKKQGYQVLYSIITSCNEGSLAFHYALGYTFLAEFPRCGYKFSKWENVTWLEKRLNSVEFPTQSPSPWTDFVNINGNQSAILDKMPLFMK